VRYCFCLQVQPQLLAEYTERHAAVWPEMLIALRDSGWRNYSIFTRPDGLVIGYVEADDLDAARAAMSATTVNARWQEQMQRFFAQLDGRLPDEGFELLRPIFSLDDQLGQLAGQPAGPLAGQPAGQDGRDVAGGPGGTGTTAQGGT
jgi:L-rhamnose mutarotase